MSMRDLSTLGPEDFTPLTGSLVIITAPDGERQEVELMAVRFPDRKPPRGFRQPFSLIFRPPPGTAPFDTRVHVFEFEGLGPLELFMGAVTASDGFRYEVVFG